MNTLESASQVLSPDNIVSFFKSGAGLWYILLFIFIVYAVISCVLLYHWRKYGMSSRLILLAEVTYFSVSLPLFGLAVLFIILIN